MESKKPQVRNLKDYKTDYGRATVICGAVLFPLAAILGVIYGESIDLVATYISVLLIIFGTGLMFVEDRKADTRYTAYLTEHDKNQLIRFLESDEFSSESKFCIKYYLNNKYSGWTLANSINCIEKKGC